MREIKFRAWNKVERKMVYYDKDCSSPDITLNGVCIAHKDQSNVSYIYELMQFTGLHDKNGKEIYEGDIYENNDKQRFGVVWDNGGFVLENLKVRLTMVQGFFGRVIGSIHENPELIKD